MHLNLKRLGISAKAFMDGLKYRQYLTAFLIVYFCLWMNEIIKCYFILNHFSVVIDLHIWTAWVMAQYD